jgi:hypothetical protein
MYYIFIYENMAILFYTMLCCFACGLVLMEHNCISYKSKSKARRKKKKKKKSNDSV